MKHANPHFSVTIEPHLPLFDSERLFVTHEKAHVDEQMAKLRERPALLRWLAPTIGEPKLKDWEGYQKSLNHYLQTLNDHEQAIDNGMVPVKFFVLNMTKKPDAAIKIQLQVEDGVIEPTQTVPKRPTRIDGPQHVPDWTPKSHPTIVTVAKAVVAGGFSRSNVKIDTQAISAEFSQLEAEDSADLLYEALYVQLSGKTRFTYTIHSKHVPHGEHGDVVVT